MTEPFQRSYDGDVWFHQTHAYSQLQPQDVEPLPLRRRIRGRRKDLPEGDPLPSGELLLPSQLPSHWSRWPTRLRLPVHVWQNPQQQGLDVSMVIERPERAPPPKPKPRSELARLLKDQRFPEPQYYRNVDCMGIPGLLSLNECLGIINIAESYVFRQKFRMQVQDMQYLDILDPEFGEALWNCGLGWVLRSVTVDGLVPSGLNDVIRIQKFVEGGHLSKHIDRPLRREGCVSKYSLRVFLNGTETRDFGGGLSVFHVPFQDPVVFEPEAGLALLYPQGELCTLQEETEIDFGSKYVLRADVLFERPEIVSCRRQ